MGKTCIQAPVSRGSWSFNLGRPRICLWKKNFLSSFKCRLPLQCHIVLSDVTFCSQFLIFFRCIGEKPCPLTASLCSWMTTVVFLINWFISLTCHGKVSLHSPLKQFTSSNGSLKTTLTRMLPLIAAIKKTHPLPNFLLNLPANNWILCLNSR